MGRMFDVCSITSFFMNFVWQTVLIRITHLSLLWHIRADYITLRAYKCHLWVPKTSDHLRRSLPRCIFVFVLWSPFFSVSKLSSILTLSLLLFLRTYIYIYIFLSLFLLFQSPANFLRIYSHLPVSLYQHSLIHTYLSRCVEAGASGRWGSPSYS